MSPADFSTWLSDPARQPLVMGVLNVTPDSFSDGGQFLDSARAVSHARSMIAQGADLIDIGGESTRPGAARIGEQEQIARVVPVIKALAQDQVAISIDTTRAAVAQAALDAGASIINDISAGTEDGKLFALAAARRCPTILMHMQGEPGTMQADPRYSDVVEEVRKYLLDRAAALESAGLPRQKIVLDPGFGFGKTVEHNLALLADLRVLCDAGYPVLAGTSRKSFIAKALRLPLEADRTMGTAATVAWAIANGASLVRVHDPGVMKQVVEMTRSILRARR